MHKGSRYPKKITYVAFSRFMTGSLLASGRRRSDGERGMLGHSKLDPFKRFVFTIYDPPAADMPWLAVCLGPNREVMACQSFPTLEEARAHTSQCVEDFMRRLSGKVHVEDVPLGPKALQ